MDIPGLRKKQEKLHSEPPKEKRDIHDGIFDDDTPEENPLLNIAHRLLPKTPEIRLALKEMSGFDVSNLTMAGIIEDEFRGKLPANQVDSMTVAALLVGADNTAEILGKFREETRANLISFVEIAAPSPMADKTPYQSYPDDARRIFMAMVATELHMTKNMMQKKDGMEPRRDLGVIASHIIRESKISPAGKKPCDVSMLARAVKEFNEVTKLSGVTLLLVLNADNTVSGYNRNSPRPPKPGM
jgi:hypothetical protein